MPKEGTFEKARLERWFVIRGWMVLSNWGGLWQSQTQDVSFPRFCSVVVLIHCLLFFIYFRRILSLVLRWDRWVQLWWNILHWRRIQYIFFSVLIVQTRLRRNPASARWMDLLRFHVVIHWDWNSSRRKWLKRQGTDLLWLGCLNLGCCHLR